MLWLLFIPVFVLYSSCSADLRGPEPSTALPLTAPVFTACGDGGNGNCVNTMIGNPFSYAWQNNAILTGGIGKSCEIRNSTVGTLTCNMSNIEGIVPNQVGGSFEMRVVNAVGASSWVTCILYFGGHTPCP